MQTRAAQGFNVVHAMVLSEAALGNSGGLPFNDLSTERLNPEYWQEVDERVAAANAQGFIVGLVVAWADKGKDNSFAWRRFPDLDARKRYAQYIAARYSAYDVYFLVAGEWNIEIRARGADADEVRREFIEIGDALAAADPHRRMKAIHPATASGSVREFNDAAWMSFGDYQQNYRDLNARILASRRFNKPVVNSEYAYLLRDRQGDGVLDKDNSASTETIRHASWDIVMAGGYLVSGFGTTYFGGHRDPGPFDVDAAKNDDWERQIGYLPEFFGSLAWWKLTPRNEFITSAPRDADGRIGDTIAPPQRTYWCLAEPGRQYVIYCRGCTEPIDLGWGDEPEARSLNAAFADKAAGSTTARPSTSARFQRTLFNPRTGEREDLGVVSPDEFDSFVAPDEQDWVLLLARVPADRNSTESQREGRQ